MDGRESVTTSDVYYGDMMVMKKQLTSLTTRLRTEKK